MRKRFSAKRVTALAMTAAMAVASLSGCGSSDKPAETAKAPETTTAAAGGSAESTAAGTEAPASDKPYEGVKLTW